jgi:hypothetical protein
MDKVGVSESGASGAIFFFSRDNQFIAKSCTAEELTHLRESALALKDYFQANPHTLITQASLLSLSLSVSLAVSLAVSLLSLSLCLSLSVSLSFSLLSLSLCLSLSLSSSPCEDLRCLSSRDVCRTDLLLCVEECSLDSADRAWQLSSPSGDL